MLLAVGDAFLGILSLSLSLSKSRFYSRGLSLSLFPSRNSLPIEVGFFTPPADLRRTGWTAARVLVFVVVVSRDLSVGGGGGKTQCEPEV